MAHSDDSDHAALPHSEFEGWEVEAQDLARRASHKTIQALHRLATRLGYITPSPNRDPLVSKLPHIAYVDAVIPYCNGAILLQKSKADIYSVIKKQGSEQDYICQYCFLEISDFRSCSRNYAEEDWRLLASCHVQACKSWEDRRAAYRCFACFWCGHNEIEQSAATIRNHLDTCKLMKVSKELDKDSHGAKKKQSPPLSELQQSTSQPRLPSRTLAWDSSAPLDTNHVSRASYTTEHRSTPQHDTWEGVQAPNGNSSATGPRSHPGRVPSRISGDRTVPPVPPLQKSMPFHMRTTGERKSRDNEGPVAGGFPSTDSPAEISASISQRADRLPSSMPGPAPPHKTHHSPANRAVLPQSPGDLPPYMQGPSSPAHRASISQYPSPPYTSESPTNRENISQYPNNLPHITGPSPHQATDNTRSDDTTITDNRGRLHKTSRKQRHSATTSVAPASLDDTAQYWPGPATTPSTATTSGTYGVNVDMVAEEDAKIRELEEVGLSRAQAEINLRRARGDVNQAAALACWNDWTATDALGTGDDVSPPPPPPPRPSGHTPSTPTTPANEPQRNRRRSRSRNRFSLPSFKKTP